MAAQGKKSDSYTVWHTTSKNIVKLGPFTTTMESRAQVEYDWATHCHKIHPNN